MFWLSFLLVWTTKYVTSHYPILSTECSDVLENSSLELICHTHTNTTETAWSYSKSGLNFSYLDASKERKCEATNFLADYSYFETNCNGNGSFKVKIKSVNISNHGQIWYCKEGFNASNNVSISVQVPIKFVRILDIPKNVKHVTAIEKVTASLSCEASEGRPPAKISWTKLSKDGTRTNLTHNSNTKSFQHANGMTKVQSNLTLTPLRGDNDSDIICVATNKISNITKKIVKIYVHYPPEEPYFHFIAKNELAKNGRLIKSKLTVHEKSYFIVQCICNGAPLPVCSWNITNDSKSPNLTFTNITNSEKRFYECTAENFMSGFPRYVTDRAASKANLEIDVLHESRVNIFDVLGAEKKETYFEVTENQTIHFYCRVESNPTSSISILFKGRQFEYNLSTNVLSHAHTIKSCLDDGVYQCSANNSLNDQPSLEKLMLRVRCTPLLSPQFNMKTNFSRAKNTTATFAFKAIAYPVATFDWFKLNGNSWKPLTNCKKTEIKTVDQFSNLTIYDIVGEDFGQYKLIIHNEVGSFEQLYFLKGNGKPDPPTLFKCLHEFATETSTILQWKPGFDGGPEQKFILRYKLELGTKWTKISLPDIGDETMNYTVTSLESNSNYWTELFAINSEGQSMTLNLTFKTRDYPKLTEAWILDWKLMIYGSGGIIFISTLLVLTCFIFKRRHRAIGLDSRNTAHSTHEEQTPFDYEEINTVNVYEQLEENSTDGRFYIELQHKNNLNCTSDYINLMI